MDLIVRVAELKAAGATDVLVTLGLGSCIALVLHDAAAGVGGMAHVLLPSPSLSRANEQPGRFPQTAVPALVAALAGMGANPRRLTARLVGGASMFASLVPAGSIQMGERNVIASRETLARHGIPIIGEAVGGDRGRSVWFTPADGRVRVRAVGLADVDL